MGNHIHLLLKEGIDSISRTMGRINTSYARYFNKKYNRVGHVFQDRYKSEAVEQEAYLLTLIRYIHNNPVKAKIVTTPSHYRWSSYNEYMGGSIGNTLVEKSEVLRLFSEKDNLGLQYFVDFHCQVDNTSYLEVNDIRLEQISTYIAQFFKIKGGDIETLNKKPGLRKELIDYLLDAGYSIRSISQELNVDRGVVQRLSNKKRTFLGNST